MLKFDLEKDLCATFAETTPKGWTVYNETAGFDMVLVHESGAQVGVEAKLVLNPKVLVQVSDLYSHLHRPGPDFRAVLVAKVTNSDLVDIARLLGITLMFVGKDDRNTTSYGVNRRPKSRVWSKPELPEVQPLKEQRWLNHRHWIDRAPLQRLYLPEYVPDVPAGDKSPVILGAWKIKAIKVCVWVEKQGEITRAHFKALDIDPSRWMTGHWLKKGDRRGVWVAGPQFPAAQYKRMHPKVYDAVDSDFEKWTKEAGAAL
jgi:hypothetical protein